MPRDQSPLFPGNVATLFPGRRCKGRPGDCAPDYKSTVPLLTVLPDVPNVPNPLAGIPGTSRVLFSTATALYDPDSDTPSNKATLDDLANQLAVDFYRWRSISLDQAYNGVVAPAPAGLVDVIDWTYTHEEQSTRTSTRPWDGEPTELQHLDPAVANCPEDTGRFLVLIPPLRRSGNFLHAGKAWVSIGKCTPSHYPPVYSLIASTTDDEVVFICCSSSASSSSTSQHHCPTSECKECSPRQSSCGMRISVQAVHWDFVEPFPSCVCMNAIYDLQHVSGCTWVAKFGYGEEGFTTGCGPGGEDILGPSPGFHENAVTATLSFSGSFQLELLDIVGHYMKFRDVTGGFDCHSAQVDLAYISQMNCCNPDPCVPQPNAHFLGPT